MTVDLAQFTPAHAARLTEVWQSPEWEEAREAGWIEAARERLATPPATENVFSLPADHLRAINGPRVRELIAAGERDEDRLLAVLGTWPDTWPADLPVRLAFLGLNLGFACNMEPRCIYCNQVPVPERLTPDAWRELLKGVAVTDGKGPYVYLTGGEPLLLGEELWGADGLIRAAGGAGAACNLNTNALLLTPQVALGLVSSGLGRVHISLDTHRPELQDEIHRCPGRWEQVVRGLHHMQIAKVALDAAHPVIHINCVLTRLNAPHFPAFLQFLLDRKPRREGGSSPDLDFHLIPVGGEQNRELRLTAEGYERFFTETWEAADAVWQQYQEDIGLPADQRGHLHEKMPFMSPYHRVQQRGPLREWAEQAARGEPAGLALTPRCYVGPTQGFVLPDGTQYWCGGHTVSRPEPVGDACNGGVQSNIRAAVGQMAGVPSVACQSCAGATQAINQNVEAALRQTIRDWIEGKPEEAAREAEPEEAVEA